MGRGEGGILSSGPKTQKRGRGEVGGTSCLSVVKTEVEGAGLLTLGFPEGPDVNMIVHKSLPFGGTASVGLDLPTSRKSSHR